MSFISQLMDDSGRRLTEIDMFQPLNIQRRANRILLIEDDFSAIVACFQCCEDVFRVIFTVAVRLYITHFVALCCLGQRFECAFGSDLVVS